MSDASGESNEQVEVWSFRRFDIRAGQLLGSMRCRWIGRRSDKGLRPASGLNVALDFELLIGAHHRIARHVDLLRQRA